MLIRRTLLFAGAAVLLVLVVLAACDDRRARDRQPDSPDATAPEPVAVPHFAIQIGAFADSITAAQRRDSLDGAGWSAYVSSTRQGGRTLWRVRVAISPDEEVARLAEHAVRAGIDSAARIVTDTSVLAGPRAREVTRVNRGVRGMLSRARWALSPDQRTIIVVDDPAGVENEPLPNGFVMAGEEGMRRVQVDSAWDVAPAPGWRTAAFSKGYRISAGENESLSTAQWQRFARQIEMPLRDVQRGTFSVSAMGYVFGFARPGIVDLETGDVRLFSVAGGWRVAWSPDGSRLLLGTPPTLIANDAPPAAWFAADPATGQPRGSFQAPPPMAHVNWTEGPLIDISVQPDTANRVALPIEGGAVESRGGWIRARGRVVGPGILLAATRGGRFIVALAPNPDAGEYDAKDMLVVYTLSR